MKVLKEFYCVKTKVSYKKGEEYKGNRKDIDSYLDIPAQPIKKKSNK
jgi:hypothetical protein